MSGLAVVAWEQPTHSFVKFIVVEGSFLFCCIQKDLFLLIDYFFLIYIPGNISDWEQVGS